MNQQQQELYEKLLKKVNEYCLGYAAEDVIEVIDALVDNYERVNHLPKDKYKVARELLNDTSPLQALNNIKNLFIGSSINPAQQFEIIETTLKDYEHSQQQRELYFKQAKELKELYKEELKNTAYYNNLALKYKKALEIIKNKEVNVFIFLHSGDLETYNDMVEDNRKLTQEEYELLKEILK